MSIGEKLRILRKKKKKTLREQGALFKVSINSIYRWEHDLATPRKGVLARMADYYNVPLGWLTDENAGGDGTSYPDGNIRQQLIEMFDRLPQNKQYQILGYAERVYAEGQNIT